MPVGCRLEEGGESPQSAGDRAELLLSLLPSLPEDDDGRCAAVLEILQFDAAVTDQLQARAQRVVEGVAALCSRAPAGLLADPLQSIAVRLLGVARISQPLQQALPGSLQHQSPSVRFHAVSALAHACACPAFLASSAPIFSSPPSFLLLSRLADDSHHVAAAAVRLVARLLPAVPSLAGGLRQLLRFTLSPPPASTSASELSPQFTSAPQLLHSSVQLSLLCLSVSPPLHLQLGHLLIRCLPPFHGHRLFKSSLLLLITEASRASRLDELFSDSDADPSLTSDFSSRQSQQPLAEGVAEWLRTPPSGCPQSVALEFVGAWFWPQPEIRASHQSLLNAAIARVVSSFAHLRDEESNDSNGTGETTDLEMARAALWLPWKAHFQSDAPQNFSSIHLLVSLLCGAACRMPTGMHPLVCRAAQLLAVLWPLFSSEQLHFLCQRLTSPSLPRRIQHSCFSMLRSLVSTASSTSYSAPECKQLLSDTFSLWHSSLPLLISSSPSIRLLFAEHSSVFLEIRPDLFADHITPLLSDPDEDVTLASLHSLSSLSFSSLSSLHLAPLLVSLIIDNDDGASEIISISLVSSILLFSFLFSRSFFSSIFYF